MILNLFRNFELEVLGRLRILPLQRRRTTKIRAIATMIAAGMLASACIDRRRNRRRQAGIQDAFDAEAELRDDSPHRIDHGGNAGVGGADHRQAFLDRAQSRLLQMLIGAGRDSEPAVVGQVDDPARHDRRVRRYCRENRLIANQRQRARRVRECRADAGACRECSRPVTLVSWLKPSLSIQSWNGRYSPNGTRCSLS